MRITTTTRYGLRALFDIAYHGGGQPVQLKEISKRQKISQRYLEQIFNRLLKGGLVKSTRGPRGGYQLAREASKITIANVINATQEPIVALGCLSEDPECSQACKLHDDCVTRLVWGRTREILVNYFDSVTIADLCNTARKEGLVRQFEHNYIYYI